MNLCTRPKASMKALGSVSVLIPTYNRAGYLGECIESMLSQTVRPCEIIVIDDGSTDATGDVVRGFNDPGIRYSRQDNAGKCVALNRILPQAKGDYIWLFDDDDVALPDSIEKRLGVMEENRDYGFVGSGHLYGHDGPGGGLVVDRARYAPSYSRESGFYRILVDCCFSLSSVLARRECYDKVGGFDESLSSSEDYDMLIRLAREFEYGVVPDPTFVVRTHDGARGAASNRYSADQRREKLYRTDAIVGVKVRMGVPLGEFSVTGDPEEIPSERMQLLRRSVVMASKGLISEMMSDLLSAYHDDGRSNISEHERQLLFDAMDSNYVIEGILDDESLFSSSIRDIVRRCSAGEGIVRAMVGGLWRICKERGIAARTRSERFRVLTSAASGLLVATCMKRLQRTGRRQ